MSLPVHLFLSYAREDAVPVERVYQQLHNEGFIPWMDTKDLLVGEDWESSIKKAIRSADFTVIFLSEHSVNKRGFLQKEIKFALDVVDQMLEHDIYLMPIRLEICEVPEKLCRWQYLDLFKEGSWPLLVTAINIGAGRRNERVYRAAAPKEPNHVVELVTTTKENNAGDDETENHQLASIDRIQAYVPTESVSWWEVQLRSILCSELDDMISRAGSLEGYLEIVIAESQSRPKSQASFHEALRNIVQSWQPSTIENEPYLSYMLDLIGAYTPSPGFGKVMSFLHKCEGVKENRGSENTAEATSDLKAKALSVLQAYFPVATTGPHETDLAFRSYIELLQACLLKPLYVSHASLRLIELNILKPQHAQFHELITKHPELLSQLIPFYLNPLRRGYAAQELTAIYAYCLEAGKDLALRFEEALESNGAQLLLHEDGILLNVHTDRILLSIPLHIQDKYLYHFVNRMEQKATEILMSVKAWE